MKIFRVLSVLVIFSWLFPAMCSTYVEPDQFGVRRSLLGGVTPVDLKQGHSLNVPLYHTIYTLPRSLQYLEFLEGNEHPALELRTRGDNVISVEATVVYRIIDGEAHKIIEEGFGNSYQAKVDSVSRGFLLEHLGKLTNDAIQKPAERVKIAIEAVVPLREKLRQYHVTVPEHGVVIRRIQFQKAYEDRLQAKQLYAVKGQLDTAKENESAAKQSTDTVQKGIDKDVRIKSEEWQTKIETLLAEVTVQVADINAKALIYAKNHKAEANAQCAEMQAEGDLAEAKAEALGERLKAEALATPAGRTYSAIIAARNFRIGTVRLNSRQPDFLRRFGSMSAWREMFLAGGDR